MSDSLSRERRQEIMDAILSGQKIQAIKLYREASGLDLKNSKDFVDQLETALRQEQPEAFQKRAAGCGTTVLLLVLLILSLYFI